MSNNLFYWYKEMRDRIKRMEKNGETDQEGAAEILKGWRESIEVIEAGEPGIKDCYERHEALQDSFTPEQIDFICYQIGDWYLNWEKKMWVDGKPNQHWLGTAKEQLKTMICGG